MKEKEQTKKKNQKRNDEMMKRNSSETSENVNDKCSGYERQKLIMRAL